jgi:gliding motility-associated-like protein
MWDRVCTNIFQCGLPTDGLQQGTFNICVTEASGSVINNPTNSTGSYNCSNTPAAGNTCETATPICTFNGYCGGTTGYSANFWYNGPRGLGGPLNAQGIFCGSIENNSFIKFIAGSTRVELDVIISGSSSACDEGVQFLMFGNPTGNPSCGSLDIVDYGCESPMPRGTTRFIGQGLTVGQEYYLMVDGFAGDRCTYQINAISGVLIGLSAGSPDRRICLGETTTLSVFGAGPGTILWTGPFLNQTTGQTVTATPTQTGTFTYFIDAPNANPQCTGLQRDYDTIRVTVIDPLADFNVSTSGGCSGNQTTITVSGAQSYTYTPVEGVSATTGTSITVNPTIPTTYTITGISTAGCAVKKDVQVVPAGGPQMTVSAASPTVCVGAGGTTLTAAPGFDTYTWSPAAGLSATTGRTVTANPATQGTYTYTVTGTLAGCPNSSAQVVVTVQPAGNITVSPASPAICQGQSVTLTAAPAGSYNWTGTGGFTQNGVGSITVSPNSTATYTATATVCPSSGSATVTVTPSPAALTAVNASRCGPGTLNLSVTGNCTGTITWFDAPNAGAIVNTGATFTTPVLNQNTSYYVACVNNGCEGPRVQVQAQFTNNPPNISVTPTAELSCSNGQVQLNGSSTTPNATFSWSGPGIVSGGNTATPTVNQAGSYTLTVTNPIDGCSGQAQVTVSANTSLPNINAGADQQLTCANATATLSGSSSTPGATFSWSGPGIVSGGSTATAVVNQAGQYTLTVTDPSSGCQATETVDVSQNNTIPDVSIAPPAGLDCSATQITLQGGSATGGVQFQWTGPSIVSGGSTAQANVNQPGLYTLTVTNPASSCQNSASVTVTQSGDLPDVNIAPPSPITCSTTQVSLNAGSSISGVTYTWSGPGIVSGGGTASPTVNAAGTYSVNVFNPANNCTATETVTVSQDISPPIIQIVSGNEINCVESEVVLSVTSDPLNVIRQWSGPGIVGSSTGADVVVNTAGTYSVTVTRSDNGCSASASVDVVENTTLPNAQIGSPDELTCVTAEVVLSGQSATPGVSFSWNGPGIVSGGGTALPTVDQPGTYTLTVSDPANGCSNTVDVLVSENTTPPDVSAGSDAQLSCTDPSITLNGSSSTPGAQFSWTGPGIVGGSSASAVEVNQEGIYVLTVTNPANGCAASDNALVTENAASPVLSITIPAQLNCIATQVSLEAASSVQNVTIVWTGPGLSGPTDALITNATAPGTYVISVVDILNGCESTESVEVLQNITLPDVDAGTATDLTCQSPSTTLNGSSSVPGAEYSWSGAGILSGANTATPQINSTGNYVLTVTNPANGCEASASVDVNGDVDVPDISLAASPEITCASSSVEVSVSSNTPGAAFVWSGAGIVSGGSTASATVNQSGSYVVIVSDPSNGCTNSLDVLVTENTTAPNMSAGSDAELSCTDPSITLTGSSSTPGAQFSWTGPGIVGGSTAANVQVDQEGIYTLIVTDPANGCTASDVASVTENAASPVLSIAIPAELNCIATQVSLEAASSVQNVTIVWTGPGLSGPTDALITSATAPGTYFISVTDPSNGCEATESVVVSQDVSLPDVNVGAAPELTCQSPVIGLNGSSTVSGAEYSWSGPGILSGGDTPAPQINAPGTYLLTVTNPANGCEASASVNIIGNAVVPDISVGPNQEITCAIPTVQVEVFSNTPGVTYQWAGAGIVSGGNNPAATVNQAGTYTVTVTEAATGCFSTANVEVTANTSAPDINLPSAGVVNCSNPEISISASSATTGITYTWTGPGIIGANDQPTILLNAGGTYSVTVFDPQNGCQNSADIIVSEDFVAPVVSAGEDVILNCGTGTAILSGSSSVSGVSYSWDGPGLVSGQANAQAVVNEGGTYTLTVINPNNGCSAQDEASVVAADPVVVTAEVFENPCQQLNEGAVILDIEGGVEPYTVTWSNGASGSNLSGVSGGIYAAVITDLSGCEVEVSYTVPEGIFLVEALSDASISLGDSVDLSGIVTGGSSEVLVVWTPADYLSCQACYETMTTPFKDIFYVFTATDTSGCIASDTVFIDVDTQYDLYFPSAFTPNSDGLNDRFRALGSIDIVTDFQLQIFNRWGELVFETNDITGAWDGTFKGERVPTDGFIHSAKARFIDGNERSYSGVVVVLQ